METKHTPGPWKMGNPFKKPSRVIVTGSGANIYNAPLTNETLANAWLIAAAPDLLKAVAMAHELIEYCVLDGSVVRLDNGSVFDKEDVIMAIREAYGKAVGHKITMLSPILIP